MASHTNPICASCAMAHTGLNGRFCDKIKKYVEYSQQPPCKNDISNANP